MDTLKVLCFRAGNRQSHSALTRLQPHGWYAGSMKLIHHELGPANPIVQYMTPKMDDALGKFYKLTGVQLPVEQEQYPNLIFTAGALEALGGILFILNVKLGAVILVSS